MTATATCHPDRPNYSRGQCRPCFNADQRYAAGARVAPRGVCPGCRRGDVVLLPPTDGTRRRPSRPWRRKDHAVAGDLQQPGTVRCRYPSTLTPDEIPTETP